MFVKPFRHPITGETMARRPLMRRQQWSFAYSWMPANAIAAGVPAAAVELPPWLTATASVAARAGVTTSNGQMKVQTAATIGNVAQLGVTEGIGVNGLISGNSAINPWHAVGIHFDGLRVGSGTSATPANLTGTKMGLSLSDAANTSGFTIQQTNGQSGASLIVHGDATYPLFGGAYNLDILSVRSHRLGALFDPETKEAVVYTLDHHGVMEPLVGLSIPNVNVTAPILPRIWVEATTATAQQLRISQVTLDLWT